MRISCEPTYISSREQHPDQSNIILKSKPIVLFKIEGNFFRKPNECASFVGTLHLHWKRIIYCKSFLQELMQWKRTLLSLRKSMQDRFTPLSTAHAREVTTELKNQCLHRQCLFCVSCEHQAIKTLLFTATYFYKIEICAIKSPFFLCQHK